MEILEFFPDSLLILDKKANDNHILYQNQKMQEFAPQAELLLWDPIQKIFVKKEVTDNTKQEGGIFETESELISID